MLSHSLRIYTAYFAQFLMARMAYKADFMFSILANVLVTAAGLLFVIFLINGESVQTIQGWKREEVMFIYGYSMISLAIFQTLAINLYQFGDRYIIQGQFDRVLLRPLNSLFQVLFESFNLDAFGSLLAGIGVLAYSSTKLSISFTLIDYLWLLLSGISGGLILISVFVVVASVSFHFEDRLGIGAPVFSLITFGRYPIPIFGKIVQFILCWVVPFAFVAFYPATYFLGRPGFEMMCFMTPFISLVTMVVATVAWRFGVSRYSSTGN